ncbi:MAG: phosphotransferase family protein [Planctomyces sp.]|jgi:5-methylthioribose kinase
MSASVDSDNLDIESPSQLSAWLKKSGYVSEDENLTVSTLSGGVSNRTVLVERSNGDRWVLKQALEKLRVRVDWFSSPNRIHREALGIRWLTLLAPESTVPELIFEDQQHHLIGMQAVPMPCETWKTMLLKGTIIPDHFRQFGQILGTIHSRSALMNQAEASETAGTVDDDNRERLSQLFSDTQFFESLRLEPYYSYTSTQVPEAASFIEVLLEETRAVRTSVVHGDYSPKNILVHQDQLHLIDHEVIHFGDPAFDIGFAMTHLLSKYHHLIPNRPVLTELIPLFVSAYRTAASAEIERCMTERASPAFEPEYLVPEQRSVRHTLACLLARVRGRSPLEYLSEPERGRQQRMVLSLMRDCPRTLNELVSRWRTLCNETA